ncbi:hypothetical protein [Ureaplasma ceti]|uniref:Uncharacterized protein n=1 Tax=Ureaplasma ceti TaxID=3119530 RepID=A0ABP9U5T7_9BACT
MKSWKEFFINYYESNEDYYLNNEWDKCYLLKTHTDKQLLNYIKQQIDDSRVYYRRLVKARANCLYALVLTLFSVAIGSVLVSDNNNFGFFFIALGCLIFVLAPFFYILYLILLSKQLFLKNDVQDINVLLNKILAVTDQIPPTQLASPLVSFWKMKNTFQFNQQINSLFFIINSCDY